MREIPILLIGDAAHAEFAGVARGLINRPVTQHCLDIDAARRVLRTGECSPELIVVVQSRPGEFAPAELAGMQQDAPLARVLIVYGVWCEGDSRAGKPATGRLEIAVNRWPQWWAIQQDRVANGRSPAWASPVTITQEETQWPSEPAVVPPLRGPKTVGILSRDRTTAETLGEACLGRGYAVKMLASEADSLVCDFVLWTARAGETCDPKSLGDRPWIALVDFPRVEDCERLRLLGSAAVLARPFELEELFWQIGQLSPAHD